MKIKSVSTTITVTVGNALVFDDKTNNVTTLSFEIKASFKTTDGLEKMVRDYFKEESMSLVKIIDAKKQKVSYSVPIEAFMAYAVETERADI